MVFLTYCCICGGPPEQDYDIKIRGTSWINNIGAILPSNKYVFGDYEAQGDIRMKNYTVVVEPISYNSKMINVKKGFLVHRQCYSMVKNIKDLYLKLDSFKTNKKISGYLSGLNYKPLSKYSGQFFDWNKFIKNKKDNYALNNPKTDINNKKRIDKNIKKIDNKIKFKKRRSSSKKKVNK